jgi:hypothetical protein
LTKVRIAVGSEENLEKSGALDVAAGQGLAITVSFFKDAKNMEVVFQNVVEAKAFCQHLSIVCPDHNCEVCVYVHP